MRKAGIRVTLTTAIRRAAEPLREPTIRAVHAVALARLRGEAWLSSLRGDRRSPRVVATACWQFPIYSQTFVHQEVVALAKAGFSVRFFYGHLGPRAELATPCAALWPLRRRTFVNDTTGALDLEYFRRRMPDKVAALTRLVAAAAGMQPQDLERQPHYLHAFSFARAVEAWKPDYLHSYFFYERTLYSLVASQLLDVPRGVSCYADHVLQDYPLKLVPLHLRTCDVIVATSRRIREELERIHGAPLDAAVVKPNAVDTTSFRVRQPRSPGDAAPVTLLSINRIDPKKGIEYLIDAVRILRDRGRRVQARILGAPDPGSAAAVSYDRALRERVAAHRLDDAVAFEGQRDSRDVRAFLERSDIFVAPFVELPSGDKDGIPTAVLEAMAAGCAIVATTAGSIAEVIDDGRDGLLVPQRDARALADAIERLVADPSLAARLSTCAAERARREFDVSASEREFHARIHHAIGRRRSAELAVQAGS